MTIPSGHARCLAVMLAAALLLSACRSTAPSSASGAQAASTKTASSTPDPPQYRFEASQLQAALPTTYLRQRLDVGSHFIDLRTMRQREDPLAGLTVEPQSCRAMIRTGGFTVESVASFRSDTPAALGTAEVGAAGTEAFVNAVLYELTGAEAERYHRLRFKSAPECRRISVGSGTAQASIEERPLTEFGAGSRYIVRTYPKAGRSWVERTLFFRTPTYAGEVRAFGRVGSEADFLAFARIIRDRAAAQLR
ncbi:hypothetical protein [Kribbella sp. CA-293567]|uniref:hypothetical protein n=1 Tax=Kribbella sp. CA-293567 TaxID=3002436 RepID=UPI0022DDC030|nr:hypothetical protein [Kribbella sp. CA-293567]WBQ04941.1 hypothetical protein OX958_33935 [Kribbella sp. CA-293567]